MKYWILFALLLLTACNTVEKKNIEYESAPTRPVKPPPSTLADRFLPDAVTNIYVMTFGNDTPLAGLEDRILDEIKNTLPAYCQLTLAASPKTADIIVSGSFSYYSTKTLIESQTREPDRVRDYLILSIKVHDRINRIDILTNSIPFCAYYNRITPPVPTRGDLNDEFATNMAPILLEILKYGYQKTQYKFGETNRTRLDDAGTLNRIILSNRNR
ncbi:MAG: hypothetical protein HZC28_00875 [Spirochaetes bacterium]|nr:hypothetical protein [Spirochaetota bacterium]